MGSRLGSLDILEALDDLGNLAILDDLEYLGTLDIISDLYVKKQSPNVLGLYDMTGNVMEWCEGYFEKYENIHQVNPICAPYHLEDKHVLRDGSWCFAAKHCRLTNRSGELPISCSYAFDFRIAIKK